MGVLLSLHPRSHARGSVRVDGQGHPRSMTLDDLELL